MPISIALAALATVFVFGLAAIVVLMVAVIRREIQCIRIDQAEVYLRAQDRITQENRDRQNAQAWSESNKVCPDCKTNDGRRRDPEGRILTHLECMDVCYNYCHDPLYWHAAHCNFGTYSGTTRDEALLRIGKRLRGSAA